MFFCYRKVCPNTFVHIVYVKYWGGGGGGAYMLKKLQKKKKITAPPLLYVFCDIILCFGAARAISHRAV